MNHHRDFLTTLQISRIIIKLFKKKFKGIINIGSGKKTDLKKIANIIAKKYKKEIFFIDNPDTSSVSSNIKLNKLGIKSDKLNISPGVGFLILLQIAELISST